MFRIKFLVVLLLIPIAGPLFAQVAPAARQGGIPLVVGAGVSDYSIDWGPGRRMEGVTAWAGWNFTRFHGILGNFGIQAEGRDINFGRPAPLTNQRYDTALVGPTFTLYRFGNIQPYAKYLIGIGSIDFNIQQAPANYHHDTRTVTAPGGGVEVHAFRQLWAHADYEYQFWPDMFQRHHDLNPNGFTFGVSYHFTPYQHR